MNEPLIIIDNVDNISMQWNSGQSSDVELTVSVPIAFIIAISLSCIMIFTIAGNVMVIVAIFSYRPLKIVQNMFLVSLASADIALAICVMPLSIVEMILNQWIFGSFLCKFWLTSDVLCCTASILNLCAIALDRYWAIYDPIHYSQKRTIKKVLTKIACVWVISAIISIPPLIGWNDWPQNYKSDTPCKLSERQGYVIYSSSGSFFVPLVIMTVVYYKIFKATRKRLKEKAKATNKQLGLTSTKVRHNNDLTRGKDGSLKKETDGTNYLQTGSTAILDTSTTNITKKDILIVSEYDEELPKESAAQKFWEEKQRISLSKERRASRILGVVMGVFTICWLPFFIMYVMIPFCPAFNPSKATIAFITWLGYVNSSLNPIIYTIFNIDFRRAFQSQLNCQSS